METNTTLDITTLGSNFLFCVIFDATFVLSLTLIVMVLAKSASASFRHCVGLVGVLATLLLPALIAITPKAELPVFRPHKKQTTQSYVASPTFKLSRFPAVLSSHNPTHDQHVAASVTPTLSTSEDSTENHRAPAVRSNYLFLHDTPSSVFVAVWFAVSVTLLLRLTISYARASVIARESLPVSCLQILTVAADALANFSTRRMVIRMASTNSVLRVPMVIGLFSPVVILPTDAEEWTHEKLRAAILHETAHVLRSDLWANLASQILCRVVVPSAILGSISNSQARERTCL